MARTMANTSNTMTTDELVVRARAEVEALARLYDLYYPRVYGFCVVRTAHRQQAEAGGLEQGDAVGGAVDPALYRRVG